MRRWLLLGFLLLAALAQKSGGGVGGRAPAPPPPPPAPSLPSAPAPSLPLPVPAYPGPVVVYPGLGGGGGGAVAGIVFLGFLALAFFTFYGLRRLQQAGREGGEGGGAARLRLALLDRPGLKQALRQLAERAETTTAQGLADLVDEAVLFLLREEAGWRYASYEAWEGPPEEALGRFEAWTVEERSRFQETFRRWEGRVEVQAYTPRPEPGGRYLVVSLILAQRAPFPALPPGPGREGFRALLLALAGTTALSLLGAYLAWTPEREEEALTEEELLLLYPGLYKI